MSPDEIIEAYNVVVQDLNNTTAQEAARIGNAQASLGTMAERVARPSGMTSGLANYTYNRTMRPVVEQSAAALTTNGLAQALQNTLSTGIREAKNRYEDAKNAYTIASTTPKTTGGDGKNPYGETTDRTATYAGDETAENEARRKKELQDQLMQTGNLYGKRQYYYELNGQRVPFTIYSGLGGGGLEVEGGMSYTQAGGRAFLNNIRKQGAKIYDANAKFNADVTNNLIL